MRTPLWLATLLVASLVLAGCSGSSDKAGGTVARKTIVLRLAIGTDSTEVGGFAREVSRLSGGAIQVVIIRDRHLGQVSFERGVIADVRAGRVDLGAVASRAWDAEGVTSFRALGAPLLIDSYALQERVLRSPLASEMVAGLRLTGLVGLGVLPGALRRPLGARRPLLAPSDYSGLEIGLQQSRVASAALRALGATPVPIAADDPAAGLDGVESHMPAIQNTHQDRHGRYLTTNIVLWPRTLVIFTSRQTLARLTPAQQHALRAAAAADLDAESKVIASLERWGTATECSRRRPLRFVAASSADLAAMRLAVQPVYERLERNPETRRVIAQIEQMRRQVGAPVSVAPRCAKGGPTSIAAAATPVDGAYKVTVQPAELPAAARVPEQYGVWQIVLDRGLFRLSEDSDRADWAGDGRFRVSGDTMTWTFDHAHDWGPHGADDGVPVAGGDTLVFHWRRSGRSLVLTSRQGPLPGLSVRPLERVADAPGQQRLQNPSALQGVWATDVTPADWSAHHLGPPSSNDSGPLRLTVRGSHYRITQHAPDGVHWNVGTLRFAGDTIEFDERRNEQGPTGERLFLHWSVFHDRLTFRAAPGVSTFAWGWHPWRKVG
jgi:TRAP-type C4-dicarboxylate transport system substrate-binding protein